MRRWPKTLKSRAMDDPTGRPGSLEPALAVIVEKYDQTPDNSRERPESERTNQPKSNGLEARIAGLAARRDGLASLTVVHPVRREPAVPSAPQAKPEPASADHLSVASVELIDRLSREISLERRAVLSRLCLDK